jgi:predicted nucleotidyltransferase
MIEQNDLGKAVELARKYGIGKLFLFGSSLHKDPSQINDYDFAVQDIPPGNFFRFYGELIMAMSKNTDLINLSNTPQKFGSVILKESKLIYDKNSV